MQRGRERLKEAAKLGLTQAVVPAASQPKQIPGMGTHAVHRLDEAIRPFREGWGSGSIRPVCKGIIV